jgi:hypothetical protein
MEQDADADVPLIHASVVVAEEEAYGEIRTEYVVIDEYFDNRNNNLNNVLSLDSTDSFRSTTSSPVQNIDSTDSTDSNSNSNSNPDEPQDIHHDLQQEGTFTTSKVDPSKTVGAWAAGIVLGFLMGVGPSLSMALGVGAAYYSQQEEGVAGDVARAIGDVALLSHEKLVEVNAKHNLMDAVAKGTVAFSRNCFVFAKMQVGKVLSVAEKKSPNSTRQASTEEAKTT